MKIVSRAEWKARPAKSKTRLHADRVSKFILHHTTGTYAGHETVKNIQRFHQDTRNWADIGYNFLVSPRGTVYEGRGWEWRGAHARGHNSDSIGVAYIGDGKKGIPDAVKTSILNLLQEAQERFGALDRLAHRDVGSTACPGDGLYAWWQDASRTRSGALREELPERESHPVPDLREGWRRHLARLRAGRPR